ncbi:ABC transporter permease [Streptomyces sp. NPDC002073]
MTAPAPTTPEAAWSSAGVPRLTRWLLRLHRPALCVWVGLAVALSAALLWLGGPLTEASAAAWQQYDACGGALTCAYDQPAILRYKDVYSLTTFGVLAVPFLVAAWAGAMLTSRELETGTAQLTWTQSVSPVRWLTARLAVPAVLVAAGTSLLVALHHHAWSAGRGRIGSAKPWSDLPTFYAGGPLTVALALLGLAVGALVGLLWRRSLPALVTSVVATVGVFGIGLAALPHLWPTVTDVSLRAEGTPTGSGLAVRMGLLTSTGARLPDPYCGGDGYPDCRAVYDRLDAVGYFREYHPLSHYWPLQLTGTALILTIGGLLVLAAFGVLKRRTGGTPRRTGSAV